MLATLMGSSLPNDVPVKTLSDQKNTVIGLESKSKNLCCTVLAQVIWPKVQFSVFLHQLDLKCDQVFI